MYYWSNKIDIKPKFPIRLRLLGFYMLISFLGSLIYLFILYQWYSAVFFTIFFMLVTNGIGRILDRKYDKEKLDLMREEARIETESRREIGVMNYSPHGDEINRRIALTEPYRNKKKKRKEEALKLDLKRGLKNIKIFGGISIVCNFYAAYQIFFI